MNDKKFKEFIGLVFLFIIMSSILIAFWTLVCNSLTGAQ